MYDHAHIHKGSLKSDDQTIASMSLIWGSSEQTNFITQRKENMSHIKMSFKVMIKELLK